MPARKVTRPAIRITSLMPDTAKSLLTGSGAAFAQQVGVDVIRGVIYDVLCGRNLRDSTEMLTRRRLATLNAATLVLFLRGQALSPTFAQDLPALAVQELAGRLRKEDRWLLQWILGLTDKAFQNVLRDKPNALEAYKEQYVHVCQEVVELCAQQYGPLRGEIALSAQEKANLNWAFVLQLLQTVGAQTLTIRGSEKSTYGKLFERLILGSLLYILGFQQVSPDKIEKPTRVFWLSSHEAKRESDATVLVKAGKGVRFDIGFIGPGNPEISLDKVSRFERYLDFGRGKWYMATIIIVDRLRENSRIEKLARDIGGHIVQMSMSYWPREVARILNETTGYKHELLSLPEGEIAEYLRRKVAEVPIERLLPE